MSDLSSEMLHKPSLRWRDCRAVHRLVFRGKPRSRVVRSTVARCQRGIHTAVASTQPLKNNKKGKGENRNSQNHLMNYQIITNHQTCFMNGIHRLFPSFWLNHQYYSTLQAVMATAQLNYLHQAQHEIKQSRKEPHFMTFHQIVSFSDGFQMISSFHVSIANQVHLSTSWLAPGPLQKLLRYLHCLHWHLGSCCVAQNSQLVLVKTRRLEWVPHEKLGNTIWTSKHQQKLTGKKTGKAKGSERAINPPKKH